MVSKESGQLSEMDRFLPDDKQVNVDLLKDSTRVIIQPAKKKDYPSVKEEAALYDPFKTRNLANPTTDGETLTHLLKSCLGSGILAMPYAFKNGGVSFGIIGTLIIGLICSHCSYILVKCAHKLYYRTQVCSLTFPEIGEVAFANGPPSLRMFAKPARLCVVIGIFLTYFGTCCAYNVIIAGNIEQVLKHYGFEHSIDKRWFIVALLPLLILYSYVPNLKRLAIFSKVANMLMACTISITFYYIFFHGEALKSPTDLPQIAKPGQLPEFFSLVIFAMECIGVVMPLENNMEKPKHFVGTYGVMNKGMTSVTFLYLFVGLIGYLKYGFEVKEVITLNLPLNEVGSQCAKVFIAIAVFCTYGLQFYVCMDILWNGVKDKIKENSLFYNYIIRTVLVILSVVIAIAVPEISPFLSIVGALFFSILGLIFPVIIEIIVYSFGTANWRLFKNIFIFIFGVLAMVFGTKTSIEGIIRSYSSSQMGNSTYLNYSAQVDINDYIKNTTQL